MKEFWNIMAKDILSENFTKREYIVYGVIVPLALIILMGLAGAMDQASGL